MTIDDLSKEAIIDDLSTQVDEITIDDLSKEVQENSKLHPGNICVFTIW